MRILTDDECQAWAADKSRPPHLATYLLPADAGRKTGLARTLRALIDGSGEGLLWINEWGVFPSCENMDLFDGYRRSLGEERPVWDAPGHLFEERDLREVECLLDLVLYFFWDASVIDARGNYVRISHDEVLIVHTADPSWREAFATFRLEEISLRP